MLLLMAGIIAGTRTSDEAGEYRHSGRHSGKNLVCGRQARFHGTGTTAVRGDRNVTRASSN